MLDDDLREGFSMKSFLDIFIHVSNTTKIYMHVTLPDKNRCSISNSLPLSHARFVALQCSVITSWGTGLHARSNCSKKQFPKLFFLASSNAQRHARNDGERMELFLCRAYRYFWSDWISRRRNNNLIGKSHTWPKTLCRFQICKQIRNSSILEGHARDSQKKKNKLSH